MARKKTITEFQEEQPQDMIVPDGDTAVEDTAPGLTEDAAAGDEDGCSASIKAPAENEGGTEFVWPPAEDAPLEETSEGGTKDQGEALPEPPVEDGAFPAEGEDHSDYTAYFPTDGEGSENSTLDNPSPLPEYPSGIAPDFEEDAQSDFSEDTGDDAPAPNTAPTPPGGGRRTVRRERERILTIDPHAEVMTRRELDDIVWHELENAYRTRHILTGKLDHMSKTRNGMDVAVVRYKGVEVMIPPKEMMVHTGQVPSGPEYAVWLAQISRILNARLDTDIDFVVRGIDSADRTVVGSRRDAMPGKKDTVSFAVTRLDEAHGIAIGIITRIIKQNL